MDDIYSIQNRPDAGFINVGKRADKLRRHAANASPRTTVDIQFLLVAAAAFAVLAYYRRR